MIFFIVFLIKKCLEFYTHLSIAPASGEILSIGGIRQGQQLVIMALLLEYKALTLPLPHDQLTESGRAQRQPIPSSIEGCCGYTLFSQTTTKENIEKKKKKFNEVDWRARKTRHTWESVSWWSPAFRGGKRSRSKIRPPKFWWSYGNRRMLALNGPLSSRDNNAARISYSGFCCPFSNPSSTVVALEMKKKIPFFILKPSKNRTKRRFTYSQMWASFHPEDQALVQFPPVLRRILPVPPINRPGWCHRSRRITDHFDSDCRATKDKNNQVVCLAT